MSVLKGAKNESSYCGAEETNPASIREDVGSIPGLAQWIKDLAVASCSIGWRCSSDLVLLWM